MVRSLATFPLLDGYRNAPRADVAALEQTLLRVSAMVEAHPEMVEMDCNPLIVLRQGAVVVDAPHPDRAAAAALIAGRRGRRRPGGWARPSPGIRGGGQRERSRARTMIARPIRMIRSGPTGRFTP